MRALRKDYRRDLKTATGAEATACVALGLVAVGRGDEWEESGRGECFAA